MSDKTKIQWTDATWNPMTGCTRVSPGCENCYIDWAPPFRIEGRHFTETCEHCGGDGFEPMTGKFRESHSGTNCSGEGEVRSNAIGSSTGVRLHPDRLDQPLRWRRPRRVFVNSLSDLFHEQVPDEYIARIFAVMALAPQHTFQCLTKRHGRMRSLLSSQGFRHEVARAMDAIRSARATGRTQQSVADEFGVSRSLVSLIENEKAWAEPVDPPWPLPNVWLGVTVEDQKRADLRIPALLDTPAAVRFLSCEPLLGRVRLCSCDGAAFETQKHPFIVNDSCPLHGSVRVDWVIAGGESGPDARPMHPDWARSLRDQCQKIGVPFFFKQWGEWAPDEWVDAEEVRHVGRKPEWRDPRSLVMHPAGMTALTPQNPFDPWDRGHPGWHTVMRRLGKRAAGRDLDRRTWDEYPTRADS